MLCIEPIILESSQNENIGCDTSTEFLMDKYDSSIVYLKLFICRFEL